MDCSGFVQVALEPWGLDPPGDQNSDALFDYYSQPGKGKRFAMKNAPLGAIVFYGRYIRTGIDVTHVAISIGYGYIIEAGKGGPKIKTRKDAAKAGARVMISKIERPINHSIHILDVIEPYGYPWNP
jgi:cell wall-associated NlpC family hydrolase